MYTQHHHSWSHLWSQRCLQFLSVQPTLRRMELQSLFALGLDCRVWCPGSHTLRKTHTTASEQYWTSHCLHVEKLYAGPHVSYWKCSVTLQSYSVCLKVLRTFASPCEQRESIPCPVYHRPYNDFQLYIQGFTAKPNSIRIRICLCLIWSRQDNEVGLW